MVSHRLYHLKCGHIIRGSECRFWDQETCLQGFFGGAFEGYESGQGQQRCLMCLGMPLYSVGAKISWVLLLFSFIGLCISDSILPGFVQVAYGL